LAYFQQFGMFGAHSLSKPLQHCRRPVLNENVTLYKTLGQSSTNQVHPTKEKLFIGQNGPSSRWRNVMTNPKLLLCLTYEDKKKYA